VAKLFNVLWILKFLKIECEDRVLKNAMQCNAMQW
jgi:hypothetical protein